MSLSCLSIATNVFDETAMDLQHCQILVTIDGSFEASDHLDRAAIAWVIEDNAGNLIIQHAIKVQALTALQTEALFMGPKAPLHYLLLFSSNQNWFSATNTFSS